MYGYLTFLLVTLFALTAGAQSVSAWQPAPGHQTLPLWPHGVPGNAPDLGPEKSISGPNDRLVGGREVVKLTNVSVPAMTVYLPPKGKETGAAVLVFPGGAYRILAIDLEGTEICDWLNSLGITAILVKYRVPDSGPYPAHAAALQDAQRALGMVREHAAEWHLDPHRIGVIGFSAGANLAVMLSNTYRERIYASNDAADAQSCRPDFAAAIYPAYLVLPDKDFALNPDVKVDPDGPPVFLVQAEDDPVHVENSVVYYLALKRAKIAAEMHIYAAGGHGYGLRPSDRPIHTWPQRAAVWFQTIGVLNAAGGN